MKCVLNVLMKLIVMKTTYDKINTSGWHFSYPKDAWTDKKKIDFVDNDKYLRF